MVHLQVVEDRRETESFAIDKVLCRDHDRVARGGPFHRRACPRRRGGKRSQDLGTHQQPAQQGHGGVTLQINAAIERQLELVRQLIVAIRLRGLIANLAMPVTSRTHESHLAVIYRLAYEDSLTRWRGTDCDSPTELK